MKTDRLVGILSLLLQKGSVTAPYLAERFEVSRRTISRDIEALCCAGIPVVTRQGAGGGISLAEGYTLQNTMLTAHELLEIFTGDDSVLIDLSSWYKPSLLEKLQVIRSAVRDCTEIEFTYYSPHGESRRRLRPDRLLLRWGGWYVQGFDVEKGGCRTFKLLRTDALRATDRHFERSGQPAPDLSDSRLFPPNIHLKALFEPSEKWRLAEEYGAESFALQPDGRLLLEADFTNAHNLRQWVLSFGGCAEVLEPRELRRELLEVGRIFSRRYAEQDS